MPPAVIAAYLKRQFGVVTQDETAAGVTLLALQPNVTPAIMLMALAGTPSDPDAGRLSRARERDFKDHTRRRRSRRSRSSSDNPSRSSSRSRSPTGSLKHAFRGTSIHASLHPSAGKLVTSRNYIHFQLATSFATTPQANKYFILPSSATELLNAVDVIGAAHTAEFKDESAAVRKYSEELLFWSKTLTIKGLFLCDHYSRIYFAEAKCPWFPIPPELVSRLMVIFSIHRAPNIASLICSSCGDPFHLSPSCPFRLPASVKAVPVDAGATPRSTSRFTRHPTANANPPATVTAAPMHDSSSRPSNRDKCRKFIQGSCSKSASDCRYAH